QRQDASAAPMLMKMAKESRSPLGRAHALYALQSLDWLLAKQVVAGLTDEEPRVREHALRLAESLPLDYGVHYQVRQTVDDGDPRVRYQLAFTLGSFEGNNAVKALHKLAVKDGKDAWVRLALLSSA